MAFFLLSKAIKMSAACLLFVSYPSIALAAPSSVSGVDLYQQKKYREALEFFVKQKQTATVLYYEGLCFASLNDLANAKSTFSKLQQFFPGTSEANLAQTYLDSLEKKSTPDPVSLNNSDSSKTAESAASAAELSKLPDKVKVGYKKDMGLLRLAASVNGKSAEFVFDTGAEFTVINAKTAAELRMDLSKCQNIMTSTPRGMEPAKVTEALVDFGELSRKVKVIVMNLPVNLIGANFWEGYNYEIDDWYIRLTKKSSIPKVGLKTAGNSKFRVPFEQDGNLMRVNVSLNGVNLPAVFDTGCQGDDISICPAQAAKLGLRSSYVQINRFEFGPILSNNVPARVNRGQHTLIGPQLFGGRRFTIDRENKTIEFSF